MRTPVPDYLRDLVDELRDQDDGALADYIPALATVDPDEFSVALTTVDGRTYSAGDDEREFSIQSISKPFAYAAALQDRGFDRVLQAVGVEPSGEAFDEISLEKGSHRPKNPMINAGAIAAHHLLVGEGASVQERVDRVVDFCSRLAGRRLHVDDDIFDSEMQGAERNLAIAHMLRNYGIMEADAHDVVAGYTAQCSMMVTARDLSTMGAALANAGVQPGDDDQVVSGAVARQTLSVMAAAGMYDAAGSWLAEVGIPAKSGVSGGMLGALPGQVGIGVLSPRLDSSGNSVRGLKACRRLSRDMGLHLMEVEPQGSTVLRSIRESSGRTIVELQGLVHFSGAEIVLHRLQEVPERPETVEFDVGRVQGFTDVGRRMTLEGMRRLGLDGHRVVIVDPDGVLPDPGIAEVHGASEHPEPDDS